MSWRRSECSTHKRGLHAFARHCISNRKWWRLESPLTPNFSVASIFLIANECAFSRPEDTRKRRRRVTSQDRPLLSSLISDHWLQVPLFTSHSPLATRHCLTATSPFLIDNMIMRIAPKSFAFFTEFISNRQYLGGLAKQSISIFTGNCSLTTVRWDTRRRSSSVAPLALCTRHGSTRYTSRPEFLVTRCKQSPIHFLPETLFRLVPTSHESRITSHCSPALFTRHSSLATRHCFSEVFIGLEP
jgi:hypothetical protein